jgi:hypothetical protein
VLTRPIAAIEPHAVASIVSKIPGVGIRCQGLKVPLGSYQQIRNGLISAPKLKRCL